ncbi:hypothetical protein WPS_25570 [Vulcanimicrobium alpinum]|uniref:Tyrosine-protein kinase G-rich domain-containing protein n=1 Tax=Vulcanimicrobium alpinum TaxID=3016050 RepID=A0AAN1XYY6_UNVUL|nr:polysaccharide biosynthesis tyrosine autokinase [Vulcanimicrobium alpinum]BDE07281.1 hypothetical protein WPS_25570 [Vulcanimicrobium alpinum]
MNQPIVVRSENSPVVPESDLNPSFAPGETIEPFLAILARRRLLVAGIFSITLALVAILSMLAPKAYTTHLTLLAGGGSAPTDSSAQQGQTSLPVLNALLAASNAQSSETFVEMFGESPVLNRTIQTLRLNATPADLSSHIMAKSLPGTPIVDLAVTWNDPRESARIANGLAGALVATRRGMVTKQADAVITEITAQLGPAETALHDATNRLAAFQARVGVADAATQTQSTLAAAAALEQKAALAQVDAKQAAASLRVVEGELARTPSLIAAGGSSQPNPVAAQLRTQLAQTDVQLQTLLKQYTEEHPSVKALREQRTQILKQLATVPATVVAARNTMANPAAQQLAQQRSTLRAQIAADQAQLTTVRGQLGDIEAKIRTLPAQTQRLAELDRKAKMAEFVYAALNRKLSDATIARTTVLTDVTVISPASAGNAAVKPNLLLNLIVGMIVALIIGVVGAIVYDYFDRSVKTEEDVEERLGLPVLTTVPMLGGAKKPPAPWVRQTLVESIHHLVTSLRYATSAELKAVAFTSASPGDGKSTVALATAIEYGALNPRTLIVDADMRCPTIHEKLGMDIGKGLSDALVGTAAFEDVVRPTKHAGLDVVTSGTVTANPVGLLQSAAFDAFVAKARSAYEMVVIDATACGPVADATHVCAKVDGTVFVVARNETDIRVAFKAMRRLQASGVHNVLGAVLNKVVARRNEFGPYGALADDGSRAFPLPPARSA